jgi:hypothetical protein
MRFLADLEFFVPLFHQQTKLTLTFQGTPEETQAEIAKVMELANK